MSRRYYGNWQSAPGETFLEGPEFHHLAHVVRLQENDQVTLFDGMGREAIATIVEISKKRAVLRLEPAVVRTGTLPFELTLACPLPKGDREMVLVEKITELGVTHLVPLSTRRSVVHPKDASARLSRYALEACKQSGRNLLPVIADLTPLAQFLDGCQAQLRWIMDTHTQQTSPAFPHEAPASVAILIGPEGGFAEDEVHAARQKGFLPWLLPGNILRMETAAITAAAIFSHRYAVPHDGPKAPRLSGE